MILLLFKSYPLSSLSLCRDHYIISCIDNPSPFLRTFPQNCKRYNTLSFSSLIVVQQPDCYSKWEDTCTSSNIVYCLQCSLKPTIYKMTVLWRTCALSTMVILRFWLLSILTLLPSFTRTCLSLALHCYREAKCKLEGSHLVFHLARLVRYQVSGMNIEFPNFR